MPSFLLRNFLRIHQGYEGCAHAKLHLKGTNSPTDDVKYEAGTVLYYTGTAWAIYAGQDTAQ